MGFNPLEEIGKVAGGAAKAVADGASQVAKAAGDGVGVVAKTVADGANAAAKAANGGANAVGGIAADLAKRTNDALRDDIAPTIQKGAGDAASFMGRVASDVANTASQAISDAKKAWCQPVFKGDIASDWFVMPKMVEIVDLTCKRPVDMEFDAIGWTSTEAGTRVLHIYENALAECGCSFYPAPVAQSFFYVDQLDVRRYINLSNYAETVAAERKAELLSIAYWLGAKRCRLECREEAQSVRSGKVGTKGAAKFRYEGKPVVVNSDVSAKNSYVHASEVATLFVQECSGNSNPQVPKLRWYEKDPGIMQLIEARCDDSNDLKSYSVEISDAKKVTFDLNVAVGLDAALDKMKANIKFDFESKAKSEKRRKLTFVVEF